MDFQFIRAVIIAGGIGSRLRSLTKYIPKPLLPIAGKPLLGHQLDLLLKCGFEDIYICSGYKSSLIKEYIDSDASYKNHTTILEDIWKAGTGGCLQFLPLSSANSLILFGDIAIDMNIQAFIKFHTRKKAEISLALQTNDHPLESDLIKINNSHQCTDIYCKPHTFDVDNAHHMVAGIFIVDPLIINNISCNQEVDLVKNIIAPAIKSHKRVFGYVTNEYLDDIGVPHRYEKINNEWRLKKN